MFCFLLRWQGAVARVLLFWFSWCSECFCYLEHVCTSFVSIHKHRTSLCSFPDVLLYLTTVCLLAVFQTHHLCQQHILPAHHWHRQLHQQAGQVWWPSLLQPSPYDEACRGEGKKMYFTYLHVCVLVFSLLLLSLNWVKSALPVSRVGAKVKLIWPKQKCKKAYFPKCLPHASFIDIN